MREQITDKDIFIMNPYKTLPNTTLVCFEELKPGETLGYRVGGHEIDPEENDCLCKVIMQKIPDNKTQPVFFVRMDGASMMYDPWGIDEGRSGKLDKHKGAEHWKFKVVSQSVFEQYLSFLKTRNQAHLYNAQRETRG